MKEISDFTSIKMLKFTQESKTSQQYVNGKFNTKHKLVLQDISEDDVEEVVVTDLVKQCNGGDIKRNIVCERIDQRQSVRNVIHREFPLSIPANRNGFVGSSIFWQDNTCVKPQSEPRALTPYPFSIVLPKINRNHTVSVSESSSVSLMARHLYGQIQCHIGKDNSCNNVTTFEQNDPNRINETASRPDGFVQKKDVASRLLKCIGRVFSCVGGNAC